MTKNSPSLQPANNSLDIQLKKLEPETFIDLESEGSSFMFIFQLKNTVSLNTFLVLSESPLLFGFNFWMYQRRQRINVERD